MFIDSSLSENMVPNKKWWLINVTHTPFSQFSPCFPMCSPCFPHVLWQFYEVDPSREPRRLQGPFKETHRASIKDLLEELKGGSVHEESLEEPTRSPNKDRAKKLKKHRNSQSLYTRTLDKSSWEFWTRNHNKNSQNPCRRTLEGPFWVIHMISV